MFRIVCAERETEVKYPVFLYKSLYAQAQKINLRSGEIEGGESEVSHEGEQEETR